MSWGQTPHLGVTHVGGQTPDMPADAVAVRRRTATRQRIGRSRGLCRHVSSSRVRGQTPDAVARALAGMDAGGC
jgi:hypothetical protein